MREKDERNVERVKKQQKINNANISATGRQRQRMLAFCLFLHFFLLTYFIFEIITTLTNLDSFKLYHRILLFSEEQNFILTLL